MKHTWKKTTAFIMALALVAGFAPANVRGFLTGGTAIVASAAEETAEPFDPETFVYNDVTYYNVHSDSFDSEWALYKDLLFTKNDDLGGYSIAELWAIMAVATDHNSFQIPMISFDDCVEALKDNIDNHPERVTEPFKEENTINYKVWQRDNPDGLLQIRFYDIKLIPMLPEDDGKNYVSTTYSTDGSSNKSITMSGIENRTSQPQAKTVTKSEINTYSVSSETEKKVNAEIGSTIEIGTSAKAGLVEATEKATFSLKVATEAMWSNSNQESDTKEISEDITLTAPPHTEILMSDSISNVTMKTRYNCPIALSYNVLLFKNLDDQDSRLCSFGNSDVDAVTDIKSRATAGLSLSNTDKDKIDWKNKALVNAITKSAYGKLSTHAPMSTVGATFTENKETKMHTFYDYEPLYPLSYIKPDVTAISMKIWDNQYTDSLGLKGYNTKDVDYYGFSQRNGYWIATDKSGNALTPENSPIKLTEVTINGTKMYVAANEMLGGAKITAVKPGECQLRYMIDEGRYTSVETQNKYSTNASIGDRTAIIDVTVAGDEIAFNKNIKINFIDTAGIRDTNTELFFQEDRNET